MQASTLEPPVRVVLDVRLPTAARSAAPGNEQPMIIFQLLNSRLLVKVVTAGEAEDLELAIDVYTADGLLVLLDRQALRREAQLLRRGAFLN